MFQFCESVLKAFGLRHAKMLNLLSTVNDIDISMFYLRWILKWIVTYEPCICLVLICYVIT